MKNFIIDIGNSRIKAGAFEGENLTQEWVFDDLGELSRIGQSLTPDNVLVSSVRWEELELREQLSIPFQWFDRSMDVPIHMAYKSPETLGLDRVAAAVGLSVFQPEGNSLGIDIGTCITYEFLENGHIYQGGGISPGISMRFKAMNGYTARLPLVGIGDLPPLLVGSTTEECMQSGVFFGALGEIQFIINSYERNYPGLKVYLCGGDTRYFESLIKDYIFVIPNLVLYGLNRILTYNVNKS